MSDTERFTESLNEIMRKFLMEEFGPRLPTVGIERTYSPTGTNILTKPHQGVYKVWWWKDRGYAYTHRPDVEGNYFAWTYKPTKRVRGKVVAWTGKEIVTFRHPRKARERAWDRYSKARYGKGGKHDRVEQAA